MAQDPENSADDPVRDRLDELVARYPGGAVHVPIHTGLIETEGESRYFDIEVERGRCYTFVAAADAPLSDLDLHVYAEGVEVAAHTGVDNVPVAHWCNALFDRVSAELRAYSGSGRFAFEVLVHENTPPNYEGSLWAALNALSGRYAAGLRPAAEPWADVLPSGGQAIIELELVGGRTYVMVGVAAPTVVDLDLALTDGVGRELDADRDRDAEPVLRYRVPTEAGGTYRLDVRVVEGFGECGVRIFSD